MKRAQTFLAFATLLIALFSREVRSAGPPPGPLPFPLVERFETYGVPEGLPSWKVHCVLAEGGRVWAGTTKGLAVLENGRFRTIGTEQGLSFSVVSALALDPASGDLWVGTFKGLNRLSGGRIRPSRRRRAGSRTTSSTR